jgi:hypothetical protein
LDEYKNCKVTVKFCEDDADISEFDGENHKKEGKEGTQKCWRR